MEAVEDIHRLFVFSDLRGDFQLLRILLEDVTKTAVYTHGAWKWKDKNTTVVCLGNIINRFEPHEGKLIPPLSTKQAMDEELAIIQTFQQLKGHLVPLIGPHDLGPLLYELYYTDRGVAHKQDLGDRQKFLHDIWQPFLTEDMFIGFKWHNIICSQKLLQDGDDLGQLRPIDFRKFWERLQSKTTPFNAPSTSISVINDDVEDAWMFDDKKHYMKYQDHLFLLNNKMADCYCIEDRERQKPHALEFKAHIHSTIGVLLYMDIHSHTAVADERMTLCYL